MFCKFITVKFDLHNKTVRNGKFIVPDELLCIMNY